MALLVVTEGIDKVFVATVNGLLFEEVRGPDGDPVYRKIMFERCGQAEEVERLRRENDLLKNKLNAVYGIVDDVRKRGIKA